jgi:hypothetical protein
MKDITVEQDVFDFLTSRASSAAEPIATVLRRELKVPLPQVALTIDDDTYAFIAARTAVIGESISDILRRELHLGGSTPTAPAPSPGPGQPPAPTPSPSIVVFHIPAGTGSGSWNDGSSMVVATVGDTLRIVNDDGVAHRLHTQNGRPFPHPASDIFPGTSADFVLQTTYDPNFDGPVYDHDQGPLAQFWIRVVARN